MQSRSWGDEHVVFDETAGNTHLLPTAAFLLLGLVQRHQPIRIQDLMALAALDRPNEVFDTERGASIAEGLLEEMVKLRLIELDGE
jgi:PqqD family protein of HPr-rel-A system